MIRPLIISGPSGVGKTYLEKYLIANHNFKRIQSTTTRPLRQGEINGDDYTFVSEQEYKAMEQAGKFITSSFHHGAYYGFEKSLVEEIISENKIPVTIVVPTVVPQFLEAYPNTLAIYLKPESTSLLVTRMKRRGDSEEKINERIQYEEKQSQYFEEIKHLYTKLYIINENNFNSVLEDILSLTNI